MLVLVLAISVKRRADGCFVVAKVATMKVSNMAQLVKRQRTLQLSILRTLLQVKNSQRLTPWTHYVMLLLWRGREMRNVGKRRSKKVVISLILALMMRRTLHGQMSYKISYNACYELRVLTSKSAISIIISTISVSA